MDVDDELSAATGLRARLVDVGVDLVTQEGLEALTLREIARRAGVSHGAPRRYFPTHLELLSAIAGRGFNELGARVSAALEAADEAADADAHTQVMALGRAYLDFAHARRGMYELMFRHDVLESNRLGLRATSLPLFDSLVELVARTRPASGAEPRVIAGALWANVHGLAQLWSWGSIQLATGVDAVEPLLRAAVDAHLGTRHR